MRGRRALIAAVAASCATALVVSVSQALTEGSAASESTGRIAPEDVVPAQGGERSRHRRVVVDGQEWSVVTYRNAAGELCAAHVVPGEGQGAECASDAELFARGPVTFVLGSRQREGGDLTQWDNAWVWGFAAPEVSSLELVLTNCARVPVRIDDARVYHEVLGSSLLHRRVWPHRLVARDRNGAILAEERLPLGAPPTREARRAGAAAVPAAPRSC